MKKAIGFPVISYEVNCPYCSETSYSDICHKDWDELEWGDGTPYGVLKCDECDNEFEVSIEG